MKLQIKLNKFAENGLANRDVKELKGGRCCSDPCDYANNGESSSNDNRAAYDKNGENGGYSTSSDNNYVY